MSLLDFLGMGGQRAQTPDPWQGMRQQPQQGGGFLDALLSPEVALPMAAALMGQQGNQANFGAAFGAAGAGLGEHKKLKAQTAQRNQTVAKMRADGANDIADAVETGAITAGDGYKMYLERGQGAKLPANVEAYRFAQQQGYKGSLYDWETKGIREQDPTFKREQDLRKEYTATPEYKRYDDVRASYERIRSSAQMDSGAGDIGTIFSFMKMLDPGSVVREGEFATAQNSSGVPDRVRNLYNAVVNGERLTPEQRAEFVRTADALYANEEGRVKGLNERYGGIAGEYDLDPSRIVAQPPTYEPLQIGVPKQVAPGVTIKRVR